MDLPVRIRRMFGDVTSGDGGDEFLAQILRHALDIRQPRRAQPGGKASAPAISRVLGRELDAYGF